jgi:hypothetical protein
MRRKERFRKDGEHDPQGKYDNAAGPYISVAYVRSGAVPTHHRGDHGVRGRSDHKGSELLNGSH